MRNWIGLGEFEVVLSDSIVFSRVANGGGGIRLMELGPLGGSRHAGVVDAVAQEGGGGGESLAVVSRAHMSKGSTAVRGTFTDFSSES